MKWPGLLLAACVAACSFAGSASAAGNPFGVTVVRFSSQTTPGQMRSAVTTAGGVAVGDLSAIDALAVVPRSSSFQSRLAANGSVTALFRDPLFEGDREVTAPHAEYARAVRTKTWAATS